MIKIGLIGAGNIIYAHTRPIKKHPELQIVAVAEVVPERAAKAAEPWGAKVYTDYHEMLDKEALDIAVISLPHFLHEPAAIACAEHNVHTLLEKPMSVSEASCQRINDAFAKSKALLQVGHVQSYSAANRKAREIIRSGELGELVAIETWRTGLYFTEKRPKWHWKKETAGGGMWINLGAHCLDKICYMTDSRIASITGKCTYNQPGAGVDVSAQAFLIMENGVSATVHVCGYDVPSKDDTRLYFTKGMVRTFAGEALYISRGEGEEEQVDLSGYPYYFDEQWNTFLESIRTGKVQGPTGEYGQHILKNLEAIWD